MPWDPVDQFQKFFDRARRRTNRNNIRLTDRGQQKSSELVVDERTTATSYANAEFAAPHLHRFCKVAFGGSSNIRDEASGTRSIKYKYQQQQQQQQQQNMESIKFFADEYYYYHHRGPNDRNHDVDLESGDYLENVIYDVDSVDAMAVLMDNISIKECDGRISLAYERLPYISKAIAEKFAATTHTLDLSYNSLKDLSFLTNFDKLNTLILDKNVGLDMKTLPFLPNLHILWLNNCNITRMSDWIGQIKSSCPRIRQLSLLGNPGILCAFNGASILEHNDYRMYVISQLTTLQYLDDTMVTDAQRMKIKENQEAYANGGTPLVFVNKFGSEKPIQIFRQTNGRSFFETISTDSSGYNNNNYF